MTRHSTPWDTSKPLPAFGADLVELYDTNTYWTQARDVSKAMPDKLHHLGATLPDRGGQSTAFCRSTIGASSVSNADLAGSGNSALTGTVDRTMQSTSGTLGGGFRSMFSVNNEEYGHDMDEVLQRDGTIITVKTNEAQVNRAIDILNQHGAIDIDEEDRADRERVTREK